MIMCVHPSAGPALVGAQHAAPSSLFMASPPPGLTSRNREDQNCGQIPCSDSVAIGKTIDSSFVFRGSPVDLETRDSLLRKEFPCIRK